ncbi:GNAT family N-acetyltransferase [Massilia glaciei]|uniref:N-acetyltransferase n=1 Tax=Massilia glaciei TaxID=1524097 RepID=A0A2U2HGR8_9BURK|nr:GNAT family N-acetyltransferase [Massilia glaciei]PWF44377.1 N-acetyltransferase [Massilia glaciei]
MNITLASPSLPEAVALIAELDAYQLTLYPPENVFSTDLAALPADAVLFALARDAGGAAVGCAALVLTPAYGELKRMYVRPGQRGRGVARKLLALLEAQAPLRGCRLLALETGPLQPEAIALYQDLGYRLTGPYGDYAEDPLSVFMQKSI